MKKFATVVFCFLVGLEVFGQGDFKLKFWGSLGTSGNIDQPIIEISAGLYHTVALKMDGTVVAWGYNGYGQTNVPVDLSGVKAISAGYGHTVALKNDGTVIAWGNNEKGQINIPVGLSGIKAISAGDSHTVALRNDGTVVAWGNNRSGQTTIPVGLSGIKAVSAGSSTGGGSYSIALRNDGTIVTWGSNAYGQINIPVGLSGVKAISAGCDHSIALTNDSLVHTWGSSFYPYSNYPYFPYFLSGVIAISAGGRHVVALRNDGKVFAWGATIDGQSTVPVGLSGVKAISAGGKHTVALRNDGTVVAWGSNTYNQTAIPVGLSSIKAISGGLGHAVALRNDGTVIAWGYNGDGQSTIPVGLSGVKAISARDKHTVALRNDGTVVAWGNNAKGQITIPIGLSSVKAISTGYEHTVALRNDGTVVAWGNNSSGETSIPIGLSGIKSVSAGKGHTVALRNDGTVVAWGWNGSGQTNIPVGLAGVKAISAGANHTVALRNDGTVVAWGSNFYSQTSIPIGLSGVKAISAGQYHTVALKTDGTVVAWGDNGDGRTSIPSGLIGVRAISAGDYFTVAITGVSSVGGNFSGKVYSDSISNCKPDVNEKPLPRFTLRAIQGSDSLYSDTDDFGTYYFDNLDSGKTYKLTTITANKNQGILYSTTCDTTLILNVGKNDSTGFDVGYKVKYCPALKVSVQAPRRRRCFKNITKVTYTNQGFVNASNVILKVAFPRYVTPISSDLPWTTKQDSLLTFNLGTVKSLETKTITITDLVVCGNESIRGLTQCTKAWFTKANPCQDTSTLWDKSWVSLKGSGTPNNNFRFVARNIGKGNMADSTAFRAYYSSSLAYASKIKLKAGDSLEIILPTLGKAVRLEIDQRPYTPGFSYPSLSLNTCNGVILDDSGLKGFSQDDLASEVAIDCQPIRDSYDPNDKQVSPSGWGTNNFTKPNARLTYTVRFQNTGTDTAYKVVVVDTLSKDLDITTLEIEGTSHPYLYHISGKNQVILTFTFYNINLPDSTRDKVKSNGFIQYTILARKGIKKGAKITNRAAIYFDFNSPVLTNTTANEMRDTVYFDKTIIKGVIKTANGLQLLSDITELEADVYSKESLKVYPNPAQSTLYIQSSFKDRRYLICDLSGKTVLEGNLESAGNGTVDVSGLQRGVYLLKVGVSWVRVVRE